MLITEAIIVLAEMLKAHGDVKVVMIGHPGEMHGTELSKDDIYYESRRNVVLLSA